MLTVLVIVHVLICFVLILAILLQSGKGGSLAGALGGGGAAGTVLGSRGAATMLSKTTTYAAILFLISCLGISFIFRGGPGTQVQTKAQKEAVKRKLTPLSAPLAPVQQQAPAQQAPTQQQAPAQPAEKK